MLRTFLLRSSLLALLLTGLMVTMSRADSVNLLTNPGFETGDFTDWNVGGSSWAVNSWDGRGEDPAKHAAVAAVTSADSGWQIIDQYVPATPGEVFTASVWLRPEGVDPTVTQGSLEVQFADSGKNIMWGQGEGTPPVTDTGSVYQQLTLTKTTPAGAAYVDIRGVVNIMKAPAVNETDYYCFDDFSLTVVPEPAAATMLVTALIGLMAYAWRKKRS